MANLSAGEVGGAFAGIVAALVSLGGGIKWLFGRRESRMSKLERRVDRLNAKVVMIGGALATAVGELRLHAPLSPNLAHYDRVLRVAFPVDRGTPQDLAALVERLNQED